MCKWYSLSCSTDLRPFKKGVYIQETFSNESTKFCSRYLKRDVFWLVLHSNIDFVVNVILYFLLLFTLLALGWRWFVLFRGI